MMTSTSLRLAVLCVAGMVAPSSSDASSTHSADAKVVSVLKLELAGMQSGDTGRTIEQLYADWENRFSTRAVVALAQIARDPSLGDGARFVAVMGTARLGGLGASPLLKPFFSDDSWMVRSAALQAARILNAKDLGADALRLLDDPALVVRSEAVEAVGILKPAGYAERLAQAAADPLNFHSGRPLWVPQKALGLLEDIAPHTPASLSVARALKPLLERLEDLSRADASFAQNAVGSLERLLGVEQMRGSAQGLKARLSRLREQFVTIR